jgi:membrane dipeptidase
MLSPLHRRGFLSATATAALVPSLSGLVSAAEPESKSVPGRDPLLISENPVIAKARDAALGVLQPSRADLEKGLAIHRSSFVFDSYGFAPRAALDAAAMTAAIEAGAGDQEIQDLQEEMGMTRAALDEAERAEFAEAMSVSGVTAIFQNAGEEGSDPLRLLKRLARFTYLTDHLRGVLNRAASPDDLEAAWKKGEHALYLTGNGVPLAQQYVNPTEELGYIRVFFQLGIRMMHVTYNRRNLLGDGCAEPANGGLSDLGRAAIAEMNRVGVIVDVAHSGWRTSFEAAKASTKPMVASHTVCARSPMMSSRPSATPAASSASAGSPASSRERATSPPSWITSTMPSKPGASSTSASAAMSPTPRNTQRMSKASPRADGDALATNPSGPMGPWVAIGQTLPASAGPTGPSSPSA